MPRGTGWPVGHRGARGGASPDASRARLAATQLGRDVGYIRTTPDLLNAQNDLAQADLALAQARAARLLDALRLAALESRLDEDTLRRVGKRRSARAGAAEGGGPAPVRASG